jgi:hypothetical protein
MSNRIALASAHTLMPWLRLSPGGLGAWGDNLFVGNAADAGTLVVCDDLGGDFATCAPLHRRILVITEPPGIKSYTHEFLSQFGLVLAPYSFDAGATPVRVTQTGMPWFFGLSFDSDGLKSAMSFEDIARLRPAAKDNRLSVVCSTKSRLPRHRERLAFVMALQKRLKDRLVIRGRGFEPIIDKADAITPHRYHLALENNDLGCFWTEKLSDAYLGWALPLYAGARAAVDDFPPGAMVYLDLNNTPACVDQVERILDEDPYESRLAAIAEAREKVLHEHNFFALLSREIAALPQSALLPEPQVLRPCARGGVWKAIRRAMRKLTFASGR